MLRISHRSVLVCVYADVSFIRFLAIRSLGVRSCPMCTIDRLFDVWEEDGANAVALEMASARHNISLPNLIIILMNV